MAVSGSRDQGNADWVRERSAAFGFVSGKMACLLVMDKCQKQPRACAAARSGEDGGARGGDGISRPGRRRIPRPWRKRSGPPSGSSPRTPRRPVLGGRAPLSRRVQGRLGEAADAGDGLSEVGTRRGQPTLLEEGPPASGVEGVLREDVAPPRPGLRRARWRSARAGATERVDARRPVEGQRPGQQRQRAWIEWTSPPGEGPVTARPPGMAGRSLRRGRAWPRGGSGPA